MLGLGNIFYNKEDLKLKTRDLKKCKEIEPPNIQPFLTALPTLVL